MTNRKTLIQIEKTHEKGLEATTNRKTLIQIEENGQWTMYTGLDNGGPLAMVGIYDSSAEAVDKALDLAYLHQKYGKTTSITINTRTTKAMMTCN